MKQLYLGFNLFAGSLSPFFEGEVIENHDLGAGPVHVVWLFKPGSESLPDMRLGFICLTEEFSNSSINEGIARAMLNLIDKLVFVVPTETMTKEVKDATE